MVGAQSSEDRRKKEERNLMWSSGSGNSSKPCCKLPHHTVMIKNSSKNDNTSNIGGREKKNKKSIIHLYHKSCLHVVPAFADDVTCIQFQCRNERPNKPLLSQRRSGYSETLLTDISLNGILRLCVSHLLTNGVLRLSPLWLPRMNPLIDSV